MSWEDLEDELEVLFSDNGHFDERLAVRGRGFQVLDETRSHHAPKPRKTRVYKKTPLEVKKALKAVRNARYYAKRKAAK